MNLFDFYQIIPLICCVSINDFLALMRYLFPQIAFRSLLIICREPCNVAETVLLNHFMKFLLNAYEQTQYRDIYAKEVIYNMELLQL